MSRKDYYLASFSLLIAFIGFALLLRPIPSPFGQNELIMAATLTYQKNSVKRKFSNTLSWHKIFNENKLFFGDYIFTHKESFATVKFTDNTEIEIPPNTLIRINKTKKGLELKLDKGFFHIKKVGKGKKPITIIAKNKKIHLNKSKVSHQKIKISARKKDKMIEGIDNKKRSSYVISDISEKEKSTPSKVKHLSSKIKQNSQIKTTSLPIKNIIPSSSPKTLHPESNSPPVAKNNPTKEDLRKKEHNIVQSTEPKLLLPKESQDFLLKTEPIDIKFKWRGNRGPNDKLEISKDKNFIKTIKEIKTTGHETKVSFNSRGKYYWRYSKASPIGTFHIHSLVAQGNTPRFMRKFKLKRNKKRLTFTWDTIETDIPLKIQISESTGFQFNTFDQKVIGNKISFTFHKPGKFYWRIVPLNKTSYTVPSDINIFRIKNSEVFSQPYFLLNAQMHLAKNTKKEVYVITWSKIKDAITYETEIYRDNNLDKRLIHKKIKTNSFKIKGNFYDEYYFRLRAIDKDGNIGPYSKLQPLISNISPLSKK